MEKNVFNTEKSHLLSLEELRKLRIFLFKTLLRKSKQRKCCNNKDKNHYTHRNQKDAYLVEKMLSSASLEATYSYIQNTLSFWQFSNL